jgi:hypothetical protein
MRLDRAHAARRTRHTTPVEGDPWFGGSTESVNVLAIPDATVAAARIVNDTHSQLNQTIVDRTIEVETVAVLQHIVRTAADTGLRISIAGGRHAMGGQQFGAATILLDMSRLSRVVDFDAERGLVTVEAGIDWPRLVNHLLWAGAGARRISGASSRSRQAPIGSRLAARCRPTFTGEAYTSARSSATSNPSSWWMPLAPW